MIMSSHLHAIDDQRVHYMYTYTKMALDLATRVLRSSPVVDSDSLRRVRHGDTTSPPRSTYEREGAHCMCWPPVFLCLHAQYIYE